MITARNYAAQAARDLLDGADYLGSQPGREIDAAAVRYMARGIARAQHFAIPDDAIMFDDQLKGLADVEPHLPFREITIEYWCADENLDQGLVSIPRRLIYAIEFKAGDLQELRDLGVYVPEEHKLADILVMAAYSRGDRWMPIPAAFFLARDWDNLEQPDGTHPIKGLLDKPRREYVTTRGKLLALLPSICKEIVEAQGEELGIRSLAHDIGGEVAAVLEFCEACGCSNVKPEVLVAADPAVNARRLRAGKLPIYETKVLSVEMPAGSGARRTATIDADVHFRNSPRQHLRRGHIRVFQDGHRTWVHSMTVGKSERGIIDKRYQVKT